MTELPSKKEIVGLVEAQATSIDDISKRLVKIEMLADKQDSRNKNIIITVVVAFIFIVGTVAVEVMLSNKNDNQFFMQLDNNSKDQDIKINNMENELNNLKKLNPYLK